MQNPFRMTLAFSAQANQYFVALSLLPNNFLKSWNVFSGSSSIELPTNSAGSTWRPSHHARSLYQLKPCHAAIDSNIAAMEHGIAYLNHWDLLSHTLQGYLHRLAYRKADLIEGMRQAIAPRDCILRVTPLLIDSYQKPLLATYANGCTALFRSSEIGLNRRLAQRVKPTKPHLLLMATYANLSLLWIRDGLLMHAFHNLILSTCRWNWIIRFISRGLSED